MTALRGNRELTVLLGALIVGGVIAAVILLTLALAGDGEGALADTVEYNLEIGATDIDYGGGNIWHAWTFKEAGQPQGGVPGPTLHVTAGQKLAVTVQNNLDLVHSFHTHLTNYDQEDDGSQTNTISGVGSGAMIPPGESWTYDFEPTEPGIYYYHCHSADGGLHITEHIHQGLYGAIVVHDPNEAEVRDEVIFMSEIGHDTEGDNVPNFIMNGMGLPGGEHALEQAYVDGGFDAVAAQLNKTVPAIQAEVDEKLRVHIINIGDQIHSFHAHNVAHISEEALGGQQWPANVVPLLPGAADTVTLEFGKPGLWLFHCHVVNHADAGMIGVFIIEEPGAPTREPPPTSSPRTPSAERPTDTPSPPEEGAVDITLGEWEVDASTDEVAAGDVTFHVRNGGTAVHEFVAIRTDFDPGDLPVENAKVDEDDAGELIGRTETIQGGASETLPLGLDPGNYVLLCNVPTHYELGMYTRLVVR